MEPDHAKSILSRPSEGDLVLIGARPLHGKTALALKVLAEASRAGRACADFTLEYTAREASEILRSVGLDPRTAGVIVDTSDAICAVYIIEKLKTARAGAVVVVDYLQVLDQQRTKPPVADQLVALKMLAKTRGFSFVFISQIDRRYDAATKAFPNVADVRIPIMIDTVLFDKTCFLHD